MVRIPLKMRSRGIRRLRKAITCLPSSYEPRRTEFNFSKLLSWKHLEELSIDHSLSSWIWWCTSLSHVYYCTLESRKVETCCEKEDEMNSEMIIMLDANVIRFPFSIFFNLSGFRILLVTTCPLRGLFTLYRFLRNNRYSSCFDHNLPL